MFPVQLMWEEEGVCDLDLRHIPRWVRCEKGIQWASQGWKLVGLELSRQGRHAVEAPFGKLTADCVYTSVGQPVSGWGRVESGGFPSCITSMPRRLVQTPGTGYLLGEAYGPVTPAASPQLALQQD